MINLSQDDGFDYGLPGEGSSQTNESELKIVAVEGNYSGYYSQGEEPEDAKHKQEQEVETGFTGNELMEKTLAEMEAVDPYNISTNISNLSLSMEPGEILVLHDIYESDFVNGQNKVESSPIPSLQQLCDHLVDRSMTCPTCHSRLQNKGRHVIVSQGCESYPFLFSRVT